MARHADTIITNGRLITFDEAQPAAEAIAIADGVILGVGSADDISNLKGPDTIVHDANGATVLPGFIESHLHLFQGGAELEALNLSGLEGAEPLKQAIAGFSSGLGADELLYAVCCEYTALGAGTPITRQALDAIVPDRPFAMIAHDHHTAWANTRALALAGILDGGDAGEGSEIVMGLMARRRASCARWVHSGRLWPLRAPVGGSRSAMSRAVIRTRLRQQLSVPTTRTRSNVASSIARAMASPRCTTWMATSTSWTC
jgi:predicted amidohydrolase YtcJ